MAQDDGWRGTAMMVAGFVVAWVYVMTSHGANLAGHITYRAEGHTVYVECAKCNSRTHPSSIADRIKPLLRYASSSRGAESVSPKAASARRKIVDVIFTASTIPSNLDGRSNDAHKPYPMNEWCNFFASLRDTGYSGDVVLGTTPELKKLLEENQEYKKFEQMGPFNLIIRPMEHVLRDDATNRFLFYQKYLEQHFDRYRYGYVMLLDFHDIFFQELPFHGLSSVLRKSGIAAFAEAPIATLDTQITNKQWMEQCWNTPAQRAKWVGKHILNSGSTAGTAQGTLQYLRQFNHHVSKSYKGCVTNDQGHHNWLIRSGELDQLHPVPFEQGEGAVNVIGLYPDMSKIKRDDKGYVLQRDGTRSPVVHQYNRHKAIADWANSMWGNPQKCSLHYKDSPGVAHKRQRYLDSVARRARHVDV